MVSPSAGRPNTLFANNPFLDSGDAAAAGREHRLRNPGGDGLALPAGRAADLAADREHAAAAAAERRRSSRLRPTSGTTSTGSPPMAARTGCTARIGDQQPWNVETGVTGALGELELGCLLQPRQKRADGHQSEQHGQRQISGVAGCGAWTAARSCAGSPPSRSSPASIRVACRPTSPTQRPSSAAYNYLRQKPRGR